jgi:hypothetical protein
MIVKRLSDKKIFVQFNCRINYCNGDKIDILKVRHVFRQEKYNSKTYNHFIKSGFLSTISKKYAIKKKNIKIATALTTLNIEGEGDVHVHIFNLIFDDDIWHKRLLRDKAIESILN